MSKRDADGGLLMMAEEISRDGMNVRLAMIGDGYLCRLFQGSRMEWR